MPIGASPVPRRSPIRLLVLAVVAAVSLAGCASSSRSEAGSGGLSVQIISTSPTFTDLTGAVIAARDLYSRVGLDVTIDYGADNASLITQALIAGDADVGSSGTGALYNAYAQGRTNLVSMGSSNPSITFGLALNQQTADRLAERGVTPDSPVEERVKALRGLTLTAGPDGSTGNAYVRIMLGEHGLDPDTDVRLIPNNDGAAQIAATRNGRADGFAQSFPRSNFPDAEGWGTLWLNWSEDLPRLLPMASHDLYTTRDWLKQNPDAARRVMQAVWLAHQELRNPTAELRDAVKKLPAFTDLSDAAFDAGWELAIDAYRGATPLTTQEMFDNELYLVNFNRPDPVTIAFDDLYDLSAAKAAKP
jgi:NitT/TauT family transport system substrate-binding protein